LFQTKSHQTMDHYHRRNPAPPTTSAINRSYIDILRHLVTTDSHFLGLMSSIVVFNGTNIEEVVDCYLCEMKNLKTSPIFTPESVFDYETSDWSGGECHRRPLVRCLRAASLKNILGGIRELDEEFCENVAVKAGIILKNIVNLELQNVEKFTPKFYLKILVFLALVHFELLQLQNHPILASEIENFFKKKKKIQNLFLFSPFTG
jgi:hypothetical protein